jgi:arginyl-tRNA synthetase
MQELQNALKRACKKIFGIDIQPELTRPEEQFGDYASNVALQLAKRLGKNPQEVAQQILDELNDLPFLSGTEVAGPGFINFTLTDQALFSSVSSVAKLPQPLSGQEILVEFGDPNPFKEMHIGHMYSYIVGEGICRLLENSGATVRRLSYHGDVGLQVAKAIWGMQHSPAGQELGEYYAVGAQAYEKDQSSAAEIDQLNQHIYKGDDPIVNKLYEEGRQLSFQNFDKILDLLSIKNDKRYLESQTTPLGVQLVKQNTGKVFTESQGAVVFEGEKVGLHTRVFITSKGLPTYEAKDLGLTETKNTDYPDAVRSIVITATEQQDYFKVMLAALTEIDKQLASKTTHIAHGFLSLSTGKMSSRTGDVYTASKLLKEVEDAVSEQYPDSPIKEDVGLAALKYAFLNHRIGHDIVFDIIESVSLNGNSGPYIQYAHARAQSIINKAGSNAGETNVGNLDASERSLARKLSEYPEAIQKAVEELMPHHLCNYLYELTQTFNRFYESSRIIGDERQNIRLEILKYYAQTLKNGLKILNISAPDKM